MASSAMRQPPTWYWIAAVLLLLWSLAGLFAFYSHVTIDARALAAMSAYDRAYYQSLPGWFEAVFALATVPAVAGSIALLARSHHARWLYILSLVGIVIQFGYVFGSTDLIAEKGVVTAVSFPAFIFVMGIAEVWLAMTAVTRGWLR